jgi:hypothetical protein
LSSEGKFSGVLNNIDVDGETTTPDFSLSIAGHPLLLKTDFQATVDEITGDTLLHPVTAQFLNTILVCNGGIVKAFNRPAKGKSSTVCDSTESLKLGRLSLWTPQFVRSSRLSAAEGKANRQMRMWEVRYQN